MKKLIFIFLLAISFVGAEERQELFGASLPKVYYDTLQRHCTEFGVPIVYAARLIEWESSWDPLATYKNTNGTVDKGLMMHNSSYVKDFAMRYNQNMIYDPFDWKDNMRIGINHLSVLRKHTGSWFGAICAYNMGLSAYKSWLDTKRVLPESTLKMVQFVFG